MCSGSDKLITENVVSYPGAVIMQVSDSSGSVQAFGHALDSSRPSGVDVAVARKAQDVQKAEGAQVVDMIKKAGSVVDVTA